MISPRPSVCVVTEGELRAFAQQRAWRAVKMNQALFLLGYFGRAGIDTPRVLQAYVDIDTFSRNAGIRMGKNDLWIAAVAYGAGATLVTSDRDFEHLHGRMLTRLLIP
jgi:tRNA(fMet)-specific endonuclease VapC